MKYLLDTNVISEIRKKNPDQKVVYWYQQLTPGSSYISCLSIGELKSGALKKYKTDRITGELLLKWVDNLTSNYEDQIIGVDLAMCEEWAKLLTIDGNNIIDSLLAAQAIVLDLVLVTRNIKHFKHFGVRLFNPFEEEY